MYVILSCRESHCLFGETIFKDEHPIPTRAVYNILSVMTHLLLPVHASEDIIDHNYCVLSLVQYMCLE